jgi:hypothetical protein
MNSAGVVVFVRVSRARSIAPIRVRVIGPSALGLDTVSVHPTIGVNQRSLRALRPTTKLKL